MLTTKTHVIRILLVDDHEVIRVGLRTVLGQTQGIAVVGEAGTMAEAVQQAQRVKPDVILMDVRLPDGSGIDACREILGALPGTRVIFLTSYADDDSVLAAVLAGAHGYVLKEIDSPALLDAIHSVAKGQSILDSHVTERALRWLRGLHDLPATSGTDQLSSQEERVVALVAEGKTNKEIAVALGLSDKTVKNYLANVFQKLRITRRAQAAAFFVKRQG
ncbi:MAG: response regulator transcription factor [Nitrospira sp.]|jgi:two-component system response regulator DevR